MQCADSVARQPDRYVTFCAAGRDHGRICGDDRLVRSAEDQPQGFAKDVKFHRLPVLSLTPLGSQRIDTLRRLCCQPDNLLPIPCGERAWRDDP